MRLSRIPAAAFAAFILAGCESSPTPPDVQVDVDAALTQMSSAGIGTYAQAAASASTSGMGSLAGPSLPAASATSCPYNATTKFFVCAPVTASGVTFSRSFQLIDASGNPMSASNALALASIRAVTDIDGTVTPPAGSALTATQITRHEDATLSGIQSASRTLNGKATQRLSMTGSSFAFTSNDTSTTSNLLLPASSTQNYPLGGTIVTNRTVTTSGVTVSTLQQKEEISFNGTGLMTVKITAGANVRTCTVNLAAPGTAPTCT